MATKPSYMVRFPNKVPLECDMLADALEHSSGGRGTVYERLGHSVAIKVTREDRLYDALKRARRAMTNDRYNKPRIGMEAECAECDALIAEIDQERSFIDEITATAVEAGR